MVKTLTVIDMYKEILFKQRKRFPDGTWSPTNGGYDNFRRVFRWLVLEHLKLTREQFIQNISVSFFGKYKLAGAYQNLWNINSKPLVEIINYALPEFNVKIWELNQVTHNYWNEKDNRVNAIKWLVEEYLKHNKEEVIRYLNRKHFEDNGLISLISRKYQNGIVYAIEEAYPNEDWSLLRKRMREEQNHIVSNKLKGENARANKLSADKIIEIRKLYATNKYSSLDLAKKFNVSPRNIRRIVARETWKHI